MESCLIRGVFKTILQGVDKLCAICLSIDDCLSTCWTHFQRLDSCPLPQIRVVILGQDPYHGAGQAHGLSFSVPEGIAHPPSLINIFKELESDTGKEYPKHGSMISWASQGYCSSMQPLQLKRAKLEVIKIRAGNYLQML